MTTSGTGYVAGRAVYQLILTPRATESLIGQVRVSIDAENFVPLALKVFADDGQEAVGVQATSVDFTVPIELRERLRISPSRCRTIRSSRSSRRPG